MKRLTASATSQNQKLTRKERIEQAKAIKAAKYEEEWQRLKQSVTAPDIPLKLSNLEQRSDMYSSSAITDRFRQEKDENTKIPAVAGLLEGWYYHEKMPRPTQESQGQGQGQGHGQGQAEGENNMYDLLHGAYIEKPKTEADQVPTTPRKKDVNFIAMNKKAVSNALRPTSAVNAQSLTLHQQEAIRRSLLSSRRMVVKRDNDGSRPLKSSRKSSSESKEPPSAARILMAAFELEERRQEEERNKKTYAHQTMTKQPKPSRMENFLRDSLRAIHVEF
eukprot:GFYU01020418.1.p1 GENE.GFYU01020418.1~~GFYU01020418.1.p1  ORF type:complete len:277 (-),score=58.85 GFYU01020418.1:96-926(-)